MNRKTRISLKIGGSTKGEALLRYFFKPLKAKNHLFISLVKFKFFFTILHSRCKSVGSVCYREMTGKYCGVTWTKPVSPHLIVGSVH